MEGRGDADGEVDESAESSPCFAPLEEGEEAKMLVAAPAPTRGTPSAAAAMHHQVVAERHAEGAERAPSMRIECAVIISRQ